MKSRLSAPSTMSKICCETLKNTVATIATPMMIRKPRIVSRVIRRAPS